VNVLGMGETCVFTGPHEKKISYKCHICSGLTGGVGSGHGLCVGMEEEREWDGFDTRGGRVKFSVEFLLAKKTEVSKGFR